MRRKSPKTHQEPPGPWTSGEGGLAPFDPPALCPSGIGCNNLNLQASSGASLPRHGLTAGSVTPGVAWGEKKTGLPTQLKVANRSKFVVETLLGGCGNAAGRTTCPPRGVQGCSPGESLVTFFSKRKSPGARGGAPALGGCGGFAPTSGSAEGAQPPRKEAAGCPHPPLGREKKGAQKPSLPTCSRGGASPHA